MNSDPIADRTEKYISTIRYRVYVHVNYIFSGPVITLPTFTISDKFVMSTNVIRTDNLKSL